MSDSKATFLEYKHLYSCHVANTTGTSHITVSRIIQKVYYICQWRLDVSHFCSIIQEALRLSAARSIALVVGALTSNEPKIILNGRTCPYGRNVPDFFWRECENPRQTSSR